MEEDNTYDLNQGGFSDKFGTYKYLTEIQSSIKSDITPDFILAKLNETQKEAIIELVRDAYFIKKELAKLINSYTYKVGKNGKYIKNKDGTFRQFGIDLDKRKYIENVAKITFNSFMIKIYMINIEYRNVKDNVMVELITEKDKINDENRRLEEENKELGKRVKSNITKGGQDRDI